MGSLHVAAGLLAAFATVLAGCATPGAATPPAGSFDAATQIIVAVDDSAENPPPVGGTPQGGYAGPSGAIGYAGSSQSDALAGEVSAAYGLDEVARWAIGALRLRCGLYRLSPGTDRAAVLERLRLDSRVRLAQPLNEFSGLTDPGDAQRPRFDDPYYALQSGLREIHAPDAQRASQGEGVTVAIVDTGLDARHPELRDRVDRERDHVGPSRAVAPAGERHATEVAGVVAATANNRLGIVGVAPRARLRSYRACWPVADGTARCNSFTLAQALGAAIADGNDVINLSLGGPADPLLARLVERALAGGTVVVGAVPPDGSLDGFPVGIEGVLAVASTGSPAASGARVLYAPGRDILTLEPAGGFGYASGSSLAAAHVSGAVALLMALEPRLRGGALRAALVPAGGAAGASIDVCQAARGLRPDLRCPRDE